MKRTILKKFFLFAFVLFMASGYSIAQKGAMQVDYEQYSLPNGLKVILHQDKSDPIVSLAIMYHVGSAREKEGKTGFAHFFEHMLFQRSENLPRNAFFQKISALGGTFNGGTMQDGTIYYETVPRDALEKILWMESDRMGFFINTVTQSGLEREIDIVSNEKRQGVDNAPYGFTDEIISKELYPEGHPYSWTVIGQLADLRAATLEDVKEFYATYYIPQNATLVLTGDFDPKVAKELIEKYFGEIKPGKPIEKMHPKNAVLSETKKFVFEDDYAKLPALTIVYPTVESYNKDENALDMFMSLLADGNNSPMYKVIVEEKKLAPKITAYNNSHELAGMATIDITPFEGKTLVEVNEAIAEAFARFEKEGVDISEMEKLKISIETSTYNQLESTMNKAMILAMGNELGGSPDAMLKRMKEYTKLTKNDIIRVYEKYFKGKPYLALSVVPKGHKELAVKNSTEASVIKENVAEQSLKSQDGAIVDDSYAFTPSQIDRSKEPGFLPNSPSFNMPAIWTKELANGIKVQGITNNEISMVTFSLTLGGGKFFDPENKPGLAYLTAALMNKGTAYRTPVQLSKDIAMLGANIRVRTDDENITINGNCLARNLPKVMALVEEMILSPRYDQNELDKLKANIKVQMKQNSVNPQYIAFIAGNKLLYGSDSPFAVPTYGTEEAINSITMEDIKNHYNSFTTPALCNFNIVGAISQKEGEKALASLAKKWTGKEVKIPVPAMGKQAEPNTIYFIDQPDAQQSYILVLKKGPRDTEKDFMLCTIVNHRLGSGSNGELFDVLRLKKGYTYGAYSDFSGDKYTGTFKAFSSVQSSVTREAVDLFNDVIRNYGENFTQEQLDATKEAMIKEKVTSMETQSRKLSILDNISEGKPQDYLQQDEQAIRNITLDQFKAIAAKYLKSDELIYVIVGDAKTQYPRFIGAKLIKK